MNEQKDKKSELEPGRDSSLDARSIARSNQELSDNLDRLLSLFESEESTMGKVANEMQKNDDLTDKLLKRVNSAEFGLEYSVNSLQHAVSILGQRRMIQVLKTELTQVDKQAKRKRTQRPADTASSLREQEEL